jgi:hypothetical protein
MLAAELAEGRRRGKLTSVAELFEGRYFDREVIILCARRYLRFKLSLRDMVERMAPHVDREDDPVPGIRYSRRATSEGRLRFSLDSATKSEPPSATTSGSRESHGCSVRSGHFSFTPSSAPNQSRREPRPSAPPRPPSTRPRPT